LEKERIIIENEILEKLAGKMFLLQNYDQKKDVIFKAFLEVYNAPLCQRYLKKCKGLEVEAFFNEFLSYGFIDEFLSDPDVEDIMINFLSPIYIHKTKVGMIKTDKRFASRDEIELLVKKIIVFSGRKDTKTINNVELSEIKGRVNIVYSPFGPQITITRAKEKPLSIIELIKAGTLNAELAAFFWLYVEGLSVKPANMIIAGGPGSGKTTLMNALFSFIPANERIVVIEDTLELNTDLNDNCSRLESNEEVSLADLVKNSLRMRPDRVIVGEVRGREAQDLMTAMNIGKYCMGTLHASTARETIMRLENEPMNVPEVLINLVDVFIIMHRFSTNGKIHRAVGELVETAGIEKKMVLLSPLWTYDSPNSKFKAPEISSIYRERLAEISGKTPKSIIEELNKRTQAIEKLLEKNIEDFHAVTVFCRKYLADPVEALKELE